MLRRFTSTFTHLNAAGTLPNMVNVGDKVVTRREAVAQAKVILPPTVLELLSPAGEFIGPKGPVFTVAIIAGVQGAKKTSDLIPFCHPLGLESCDIDISMKGNVVNITCTSSVTHKTGVEMEALTGATVAALTVYDMCKAISQDIVISDIQLVQKSGGKHQISKKLL
jgi:cyclic pyranopterin phosphate synthase